jgi:hypothetical protein
MLQYDHDSLTSMRKTRASGPCTGLYRPAQGAVLQNLFGDDKSCAWRCQACDDTAVGSGVLGRWCRISQVVRLSGGDCFVAEAPRNDMTRHCMSLRARLAERGNLPLIVTEPAKYGTKQAPMVPVAARNRSGSADRLWPVRPDVPKAGFPRARSIAARPSPDRSRTRQRPPATTPA